MGQKPNNPPPKKPGAPRGPINLPDDRRAEAIASAHEIELENELHSIYDESEDAKTDMTRLDIAHHSTVKKALVGLTVFFAVLAAVSWAGVLFFSPTTTQFEGEGVSIEVEAPTSVKSGEEVSFAVRYKNGERVALGTANLELRLPKEFVLSSAEPAGDGKWKLGSIAPGKEGMIAVKGVILAPAGKELDVQAVLTYLPADFNSEFQKVMTKGMRVDGSVLSLAVTGPAKVLPGDQVTLTYAYKNESTKPFEKLRVRAEYPQNFIPESSDPKPSDTDFKEWAVAKLDGGKDGKITVKGSFASDAQGATDITAKIGFLDDKDQFALQQEKTFSTDVLKGDLVTSLILNGKNDAQAVRFGDTLRYAVTYKNTGTATLGNVSLTATFDSLPSAGMIDWNKLVDKAKGVREGNGITWSKKQIPSLARIAAGDGGTLDFEIPFIDKPIAGAKDGAYEVSALVQATIETIDDAKVNRVAKTAPVTAKAVSDAVLTANARYFNEDGIPVGTGPLPPKAGEKTSYRVTLKLDNTLHELADLRMSAKLPQNVQYTGNSTVDAGDLRFDAAGGKMLWTLNWMPTNVKTLTVSFDIAITPTDDQKGKFPTIVDAVILETTDKANGFPMLLSSTPLTTELLGDASAAGKGKVQ